jgi:hypothetical protein
VPTLQSYSFLFSKPQHPHPSRHIDQRGKRGRDVGEGRRGEHVTRGGKIAGHYLPEQPIRPLP